MFSSRLTPARPQATLRELESRIKSVKNIGKIVRPSHLSLMLTVADQVDEDDCQCGLADLLRS